MNNLSIMTIENLHDYDSTTLASVLKQLNYTELCEKVSKTSMTGQTFINIQPNVAQFVFLETKEHFQFTEFMNSLNKKQTETVTNDSLLDSSFNTLFTNNTTGENLFLNDDFNTITNKSVNQTATRTSNTVDSNKENNQNDQGPTSAKSPKITSKGPQLPFIFQYPFDKLQVDLQTKLSDPSVPLNESDVNEIIKQAFNKMRFYKL